MVACLRGRSRELPKPIADSLAGAVDDLGRAVAAASVDELCDRPQGCRLGRDPPETHRWRRRPAPHMRAGKALNEERLAALCAEREPGDPALTSLRSIQWHRSNARGAGLPLTRGSSSKRLALPPH